MTDLQKQVDDLTAEVAAMRASKACSSGPNAVLRKWRVKGLRSRVKGARDDKKWAAHHRVGHEEEHARIVVEIRDAMGSEGDEYRGGEGEALRAARVARLNRDRLRAEGDTASRKGEAAACTAESERLGGALMGLKTCDQLDPAFMPFLAFSVSLVAVCVAIGGLAGGGVGVASGVAFSMVTLAFGVLVLRERLTGRDRYEP